MSRPPGRPPMPSELRLLHDPRSRAKPQVAGDSPPTIPDVPDGLHPAGRAAWALYWQHGRTWLKETDRPIVERLCRLIGDAAVLREQVEADGLVHRQSRTRRATVHHSYNVLLGLSRAIERLEASCGFSPVDRGRIKVERDDSEDPLAKWMRSGDA